MTVIFLLKKIELINLEDSLEKARIPEQIEILKKDYKEWIKEAKELKAEFESEYEKEKTDLIIENLRLQEIKGVDESFYKNGGLLVAFDESQQSKIGTYARISCFKFGESQVWHEDGKYQFKNYMYKPMMSYIEDSRQKVEVYRMTVNNFVANLEMEFKSTPLQSDIDDIKNWLKKFFPIELSEEWKKNMPTVSHVADRIRTADELLCTVLRMKQIKDENPDREIIFLGDGIAAFRPHRFPPTAFVKFFLNFLKQYDLKYYTFSKVCRLREKGTGTLILPVISAISYEPQFDCKPFIVEIPQIHSKSNSFLVRLIKRKMPALRFDVPMDIDLNGAISILKKLIPFSPTGYPLPLEYAHKSSQLTSLEWNDLSMKHLTIKENPKTKELIKDLRDYVLPSS